MLVRWSRGDLLLHLSLPLALPLRETARAKKDKRQKTEDRKG